MTPISLQKVKTKNTFIKYVSSPQFLRDHQEANAKLQLSLPMDGTLSPVTVQRQLFKSWLTPLRMSVLTMEMLLPASTVISHRLP